MPLAGEHIAIGLAILASTNGLDKKKWPWPVLAAATLAISPDLDILPGIILHHDWGYYHRQAFHSLLYSGLIGFLAAFFLKFICKRKLISPWTATAIAFSHVLSDYILSPWPVDFCWPFYVPLAYSHHALLRFFYLTDPLNRAGFIFVSCFAIVLIIYWREQNLSAGEKELTRLFFLAPGFPGARL